MKYNTFSIYTSVLLTIVVTFCAGCLKNDERRYTIKGHIYQNCSRQPVANQKFVFYQAGGGGDVIDSVKTDSNGYFTLNYVPKNGSEVRVGIPLNVGISEYGEFPPHRDYPNIALYKEPTCYLKVSMQVFNNSYTNKDTLFVTDFKQPNIPIKVAGPFTNRLLYTVPNHIIMTKEYPTSRFAWYYKMNGESFRQQTIYFKACDTANAIVEIR